MSATAHIIDITPEEHAEHLAELRARAENRIRASQTERPTPTLVTAAGTEVWSLPDLSRMPEPRWLIENVLEEQGLTVLFSPDKLGKTQLISNLLWAWTAGLDSYLHPDLKMHDPTELGRSVLYVLLEGQASYYPRFRAWREWVGRPEEFLPGFHVISGGMSLYERGMDLEDPTTWTQSAVGLWQAMAELRPAVLVIDTLSRATAGMDENSSDMARFVKWMDMARDEFGISTVVVHHTPLGETARPRGHSSLKGAASSYVHIEGKPEEARGLVVTGPHRNAESRNPQVAGTKYGYSFKRQPYGGSFVLVGGDDSYQTTGGRPRSDSFDEYVEAFTLGETGTAEEDAERFEVTKRTILRWRADIRTAAEEVVEL
jgi:hypothetical protein